MNQLGTVIAVFAVAVGQVASPSIAQDKTKKDDVVREIVVPGDAGAAGPRAQIPEFEVFHLKITPAAEPVPALKYRLYPTRIELKPGNSVTFYYRALLLLSSISKETRQKFYDLMDEMDETPFAKYESENFRKTFDSISFASALDELATAVTRETTDWDWQFNQLTGTDPIAFRLEEVQQSRELARILSVKSRLEAAEGDLDTALADLKTMFRLSTDIGESPLLISNLVGIAISHIAAANLRDIISQTDCPNLYWALATLPDPPVDMRYAMEQEAGLIGMMFPFLKDPENERHSASEWARLVRDSFFAIQQVESAGRQSQSQLELAGAAFMIRGYPIAKRELIASGMDPKAVERMPVGQAIAVRQKQVTQYMYDETFKWGYLPALQAAQHLRDSHEVLREEGYFMPGGFREIVPMASLLLPAVRQVQIAQVRISSLIKGLMALEAIRMHMAKNNGKLPESLDAITVVPVPPCPFTGEPFPYRLENGKAVLTIQTHPDRKQFWWELHLEPR